MDGGVVEIAPFIVDYKWAHSLNILEGGKESLKMFRKFLGYLEWNSEHGNRKSIHAVRYDGYWLGNSNWKILRILS